MESPELEVEPLVEDTIVLIGLPSMSGKRWEPRELQSYTWISREEGSSTRRLLDEACRDLGISPRRRLELPSWEAVKLAVASGAGIAACSRFAIDVELKAGTLSILDVPRWELQRTISIIYAMEIPLTPPAEQFLRLLHHH